MKLLLYCVKAKPYLLNQNVYEFYDSKYITSNLKCHKNYDYTLNGKIVAECDFDVEEIEAIYINEYVYDLHHSFYRIQDNKEWLDKTYLNMAQLDKYLNGKNGYAIHIKNLHIFDKPKELSEYMSGKFEEWDYRDLYEMKKAPQNMQYVSSFYSDEISMCGDTYLLISIRPEWLCKILNGEKTIEVRKKVLKEMLKND